MPNRVTTAALALATASMLTAGYVLLRPANETTSCECGEVPKEALATLEQRVGALEQRDLRGKLQHAAAARPQDETLSNRPKGSSDPDDDDEDPRAEAVEEKRNTPRFVDFEVSEPGVAVTQNADGAIAVSSDDAELVGRVLTIRARGEDGEVQELTVTVPPVQ